MKVINYFTCQAASHRAKRILRYGMELPYTCEMRLNENELQFLNSK